MPFCKSSHKYFQLRSLTTAEMEINASVYYYAKYYPALELQKMLIRRFIINYQTQL